MIEAGSLQPVSPTEPTPVTFVPEVVAANPALAGVQILVPPGALFDDNGNRGGRVGIAPVPPDRLPEPLPEGLNFPLVITIQTDGPRNFAVPVPVRFPNLPDPVKGVRLPPGAKTALWSFDHDKGYWEIVGPAPVTADGAFVETDPGVGVLQPGWHGVQPGVEVSDGKVVQECEPQGDAVMGPIFVADMGHGRRRLSVEAEAHTPGIVNWFCATAAQQGLNGDVVDFEFCEPGEHRITAVLSPDCYRPVRKSITVVISEEEVCSMEPLLFGGTLGMGEAVVFGPFDHTPGRIEWTVQGGRPSRGVGRTFRTVFCEPGVKRVTRKLTTDCGRTCEVVEEFEVVDRTIAPFTGCFTGPAFAPIGPFYVGEVQTFYAPDHTAGTLTWDAPQGLPDRGAGEEFRTVFDTPGLKTLMLHFRSECGQECSLEYTRLIEVCPPSPQAVTPSTDAISVRVKSVTQVTGAAGAVLFAADCPEVALPDTGAGGVFTLRVRNNTTFRQTPRVLVRPVIERVFDLVDLAGGAVHRFAPGSGINGPGSRDVHRFLLPGNMPVAFGLGRWSGPHLWELQDTAGRRIFGPADSWAERVRTVSVPAGEYRLILTGTVASTDFLSGYSLVAGRPGVETSTHDLRTERLLEVREDNSLPGHRRMIEVDLEADQVVEISFNAGDEGCEEGLTFRFLAPDGSVCLETRSGECGRNGVLQLGAAGRYRAEIVAEPDARPQGWWLRIERSRQAAGQWLPLPGAEQMPALNAADFNEGGMAMLVRDDGGTLAQAEIFLAGRFGGQTLIGRLHNGAWQTLGAATRPAGGGFSTLPVVNAIVHDGAALYVAGNFTQVNGAPTPGVARWDGTLWTTLGSGVRVTDTEWFGELYEVKDLAFVDGQLYAAGRFRVAGGVQTFNLARWDPVRAEWNKVAGPLFSEHLDGVGGQRGPNDFSEIALSLATLGDTLFIAGSYQFPARNAGAWRNHQFADGLGGGVMESTFNPGEARLVRTANGQAYFQGNFRRAGVLSGNVEVDGFAVWTGTEWRRAPTLLPYHNSTHDFAVDGDRIVVGGSFNRVNNDWFGRPEEERDSIPVNSVALWDGAVWRSPGLGVQLDLDGGGGGGGGGGEARAAARRTRELAGLHDTAGGPPRLLQPGTVNRLHLACRRLYVTGRFTHAGGQPSPPLAVWESAP